MSHCYPVLVTPVAASDGGGYLAFTVLLPGCFGDGETPEAAVADLDDAIAEWLDEASRLGRSIPPPPCPPS